MISGDLKMSIADQSQSLSLSSSQSSGADAWMREQMFEEDVRAVLAMMRPHGRERLMGWKEYRTGGPHFRVTVSWDDSFERTNVVQPLVVPNMTDVLENLLVGSSRENGDLPPKEEFDHYRSVVRELYKRINEMEQCYT
jgi:hypothetical protein